MLKDIYTFVNNWNNIYGVTSDCLKGEKSKEVDEVKQLYVEVITELMKMCNDIEILDLIMKLLDKSTE